MNTRVVVLGATGMAGHVISLYLEERGYDVFRTSRSISRSIKSTPIDASNIDELLKWTDSVGPDVVVNAIGILPTEASSRPDLAVLLNSYLPRRLEKHLEQTRVKLIHLSTDCVFSGNTGGYRETSQADGPTIYDRSKSLGEVVNDKDLTFRMSIIGPDIDLNGTGLFNWFMHSRGRINGYTNAVWNGVTTIELSRGIQAAIEQDLTGLYHLTPHEKVTKYELLCMFKKQFGKNDVEVIPYHDFVADKTLVNTRMDFDFCVHGYLGMIHEMATWIHQHKELYNYE